MDRITYEVDFDNQWGLVGNCREAKKIVFDFDGDLDIYELKTIFIRLAKALGYHEDNILEVMGTPDESPEDIQVKERIHDMMENANDEGDEITDTESNTNVDNIDAGKK